MCSSATSTPTPSRDATTVPSVLVQDAGESCFTLSFPVPGTSVLVPYPARGASLSTLWPADLLITLAQAAKLCWHLQQHFVRCFREDAPHCLKLVFEPLCVIIASARPVRLAVDVATLRTSAVVQEQFVVFMLFVSYMDVLLHDTTMRLRAGGGWDAQWLETLPAAVQALVTEASTRGPDGWREAEEHLTAWREAVQQSAVLAGLRRPGDPPVSLTPLEALRRMQAAMSVVPPGEEQAPSAGQGRHQERPIPPTDDAKGAATSRPLAPAAAAAAMR